MSHIIAVDRIACTGHGLCAELFPEHIGLDEWGYPVLRPGPVPAHQTRHARRTVAACPALAMRLETLPRAQSAART
jgi:ferredoxin